MKKINLKKRAIALMMMFAMGVAMLFNTTATVCAANANSVEQIFDGVENNDGGVFKDLKDKFVGAGVDLYSALIAVGIVIAAVSGTVLLIKMMLQHNSMRKQESKDALVNVLLCVGGLGLLITVIGAVLKIANGI